MRGWQSDFRWRLYGAIVLVVSLVSGLYTGYTIRSLAREAEDRLLDQAETLGMVLASALARPMFDINEQAVSSVVKALGATPDLARLAVMSPEGKLEASAGLASLPPDFDGVSTSHAVVYNDGSRSFDVGRVELALFAVTSRQDLRNQAWRVVQANLLLTGAILALLYLIGRQMARPLTDIQNALTRLAGGDTDIQLSGRQRPDQIGRLSQAVWVFRDALQRLHETEQKLLAVNAGLESAVQDRTRHLQTAVAQVQASRRQLQAIVDISTDAVILIQASGAVQGWSNRAAAMLGWSAEEVTGQQVMDTLHPRDEGGNCPVALQAFTKREVGKLSDESIECWVTRKDGGRLPVEWTMGLLVDDAAEPQQSGLVCVFLRDLTHRRRAEEDTRVALARKAELYELRSRFIAMASHEFRTPLTSILSSVELLKHYRDRMEPKELDELLESVEAGVARMTRMLDRVLVIGKADADRMEFSPRRVHLADLCHELALEAKNQAPHTQVRLIEAFEAGDALLDDGLLRHILGNLLSNAIKYSPSGGEVRFSVHSEDDHWVFSVSDQGIGIPATELPHVFASFHRCSNATDIPGTGLGLAVVHRAVAVHGGTVTVDSEQGKGSKFTVRLPRKEL